MNASNLKSPTFAFTAPSTLSASKAIKSVVNAFDVGERRFGEHFDVSTHAAVIKMMMATLGPTPADMFNQVTPTANGYDVMMKDEFNARITHEELQLVAQVSKFSGNDAQAVRAANFALTVFVKRRQQIGGYANFHAALTKSLQGETTLRCLQGMGVYGLSQYVPPSRMVGEGVVAVMETHNFGSALVVDGLGHANGKPRQVGGRYGYRLFADKPRGGAPTPKVVAGRRPLDIWGGFYQGTPGNCVTVSAIKAAMMRFGQCPADIFREVTATAEGYAVVMRDGFRLTLTHEQLRKARAASGFRGNDCAMLEDAYFLFAVSARRAQLENNDFRGGQSFDVAIDTLNDGEYPGQALRRLGLYAYIRESDVNELIAGAIGTLSDGGHSMTVIGGVLDYYGSRHTLQTSQWKGTYLRALKLV
jgi:hypothetical protein